MNQPDITAPSAEPPQLIAIRETANRIYIPLLWGFAAIIGGVAYAAGNSLAIALGVGLLSAVAATLAWRMDGQGPTSRYTIAAAFACDWMALIYASSGTGDGFILDAHMLYFIINAFVLAYFCWRSIMIVNCDWPVASLPL